MIKIQNNIDFSFPSVACLQSTFERVYNPLSLTRSWGSITVLESTLATLPDFSFVSHQCFRVNGNVQYSSNVIISEKIGLITI